MMVNAADCKLSHDAGVAGTIIDKGGFGIQKEFIEFFQIQKDRSLAASTTAPKPPSSKREKNKGKNETDDVNDPLISDSDSSSKSFCDAVTSNRREDALNGKGLRVGPSEGKTTFREVKYFIPTKPMLGLCLQFIGCIRLVESRFQCYSRTTDWFMLMLPKILLFDLEMPKRGIKIFHSPR